MFFDAVKNNLVFLNFTFFGTHGRSYPLPCKDDSPTWSVLNWGMVWNSFINMYSWQSSDKAEKIVGKSVQFQQKTLYNTRSMILVNIRSRFLVHNPFFYVNTLNSTHEFQATSQFNIFPTTNRLKTLQGYFWHQCRTNVTHIGPIRKYFENVNFCRYETRAKKLAKFKILPIFLMVFPLVTMVTKFGIFKIFSNRSNMGHICSALMPEVTL